MRTLTIVESITLDGVMQAPGRPDEDRRGGFEHGGWAAPYSDEAMAKEMGKGMGQSEMLFGRRTYESMFEFWPRQTDGNPYTEVLNNTRKYVASNTLNEPLPWQNSTLLSGEAGDRVADLKQENGSDLVVLGSGDLVRGLMDRDLVDTYVLLIHPLVLGTGTKLFADDGHLAKLELQNSVTTPKGVVIATYGGARA